MVIRCMYICICIWHVYITIYRTTILKHAGIHLTLKCLILEKKIIYIYIAYLTKSYLHHWPPNSPTHLQSTICLSDEKSSPRLFAHLQFCQANENHQEEPIVYTSAGNTEQLEDALACSAMRKCPRKMSKCSTSGSWKGRRSKKTCPRPKVTVQWKKKFHLKGNLLENISSAP